MSDPPMQGDKALRPLDLPMASPATLAAETAFSLFLFQLQTTF